MEVENKILGKTSSLLYNIKLKFKDIKVIIEENEIKDKQFKDFFEMYYHKNDMTKIDTVFILDFTLNDDIYKGFSLGSYDIKTNISKLFFEWETVPKYEVQAGSGGSSSCCLYSTFSRAYHGSLNISSITGTLEGLPLDVDVTYLTLNDDGEIIFQGYQKTILRNINGIRIAKTKVWGFIDEQFKLLNSPGYAVYLTQKDNTILGLYNQLQKGVDGKLYYEEAIREYRSYSNRRLPFDEIMIFKYTKSDFNVIRNNKRIDSLEHIAYYMPAKEPFGNKNG